LQAEARVQAAQSTALEIGSQSQRWQGTLATLLGGVGKIDLASNIPAGLPDACSGSEPIWDTVPTVQAAASKKTSAEASLRFTRSDSLPTLQLQAGGDFNLLDGFSTRPDYTIGLQLTGKLYNGGSYAAKQSEGKYAVDAAEAGIAAARTDAMRSWRESGTQVAGMSTLLASLASRQGLMRETRDLYQRQFLDLGTRTLLDVLNADQELHAARFDAINTRFDLYKLNIECAYSAGRLREIFDLDKKPGMPSTLLATARQMPDATIEMTPGLPPQQLLPKAGLPLPSAAEPKDTIGKDSMGLYIDPAVNSLSPAKEPSKPVLQASAEPMETITERVEAVAEPPAVSFKFDDIALRGSHEISGPEKSSPVEMSELR
jgi:adhesin transport system outer membrane protein